MKTYAIAVLGTFDLQNYGDLLFPLLTRRELAERLGSVEVLPFSYHRREEPDWPYRVLPVEEFPDRLAEIDGVVVGGGHVVRFDREVAPGYGPGSPEIHHPTGLWLFPAFVAATYGLPVVWNGIGASPEVGSWAPGLFAATLESSRYVSVRDRAAQATLRAMAPVTECAVVPDSGFGVRALLEEGDVEEGFRRWRRAHGLEGPYVVVQAAERLEPVAADLRRELATLAERGIAAVELPIGPVLGDSTGWIAPDSTAVVRVESWPSPLLLARIIGGAEAAVGPSLHLGITALCHGVPVHRPRSWPGQKYESLAEFPGVFQFDEIGREPRLVLAGRTGRGEISSEVARHRELLARHWDRIAAALEASPGATDTRALSSSRLPRELIRCLNALARGEDAREESAVELRRQAELWNEAERGRERLEAELVEARRSLEERRATATELRAWLEDLRRSTGEERGRLEGELEALNAVRRSRTWRLAATLGRIYAVAATPWRWARSLISRSRRDSPGT